MSNEDYRNDPDLQWIAERGLLNVASLKGLYEEHVIPRDLRRDISEP